MFLQHLRYSCRLLARSPVFTSVAILTFALAIGATTAVFSLVRATILAPLPFPDPDRLVSVWPARETLARSAVSPPTYLAIRDETQVFSAVAAFSNQSQNLTGNSEPERAEVARVTHSFQAVMGSRMELGRWFTPDEDAPNRNAVAVLSHALWIRRFSGDPGAVGRTITLNAVPHLVVGVMHAESTFPAQVDLWVPIAFTDEQRSLASRGWEFLGVIGRLRPGISLEQARASLAVLARTLMERFASKTAWTLGVATLDEDLRGALRPIVLSVFIAVLLVLVVACANVTNLMLARAADRRRDYAVRLAVGARPGRIRVEALIESATVGVIGGLAGIVIAWWLSPLLAQFGARAGLDVAADSMDGLVLLFALVVTLTSALLAGVLPAWHLTHVPLAELLDGSANRVVGRRMRPALVMAEIALAFVVVVAAALLTKSLGRLTSVDPGFGVDQRLTLRLTLPQARYPNRPLRHAFYDRLFDDLRVLPGVQSVGGVSELPLGSQRNMGTFDIERRAIAPGEARPHADMRSATPGYFESMGIALVRGRVFDDRDGPDAPLVALIDDTVVKRFFGSDDPVGRRVALAIDPPDTWREIVGIVGSVRHDSLEAAARGTAYVPLAQRPSASIFAVLRSAGNPMMLVPSVKGVLKSIDPELPLYDVETLSGRLRHSVGRHELTAVVVGIFGALALVLALTGVYGLVAYAVTQRTREVGVRMALGADRWQVLWLFVRASGVTALAGIAVGTALAVPLAIAGSSLLFRVLPYDPALYLSIAAGFVLITVIVSALSAVRATAIDPLVALRES